MFKHILHDPANVTDQELNFLDTRRKMEKQLILDKDVHEEDDDQDSEKKMWFVISGDWLYQWKCFISNKVSNSPNITQEQKNKVSISTNEDIGVLPPGPIYNDFFFTRRHPEESKEEAKGEQPEMVIRAGLQLNKDYRGVNFEVWNLLQKIYGGGPLIVRD
jgi:hypothetical protein